MRARLVVAPVQHLAVLVEPRDGGAVAQRHVEFDVRALGIEALDEESDHGGATFAGDRRERYRILIAPRLIEERGTFRRAEQIDLVEDLDHAALDRLAESELSQHGMNIATLRLAFGMV